MDDIDADEVPAEDSDVLTPDRSIEQPTRHRLKLIAQVSEYWLLSKLATVSDEQMLELTVDKPLNPRHIHAFSPTPKIWRIILLGSGTLLTLLTHQMLAIHADLMLADKLVPQGVLALILSKTELIIVKKFPGNGDKSQEEMMHLAVEGAWKGFAYNKPISLYTTTPLKSCIPLTHRGVAKSVVVCTVVEREVQMPEYERIILMGVARLQGLLLMRFRVFLRDWAMSKTSTSSSTTSTPAPLHPNSLSQLPSSNMRECPDQRVTTAWSTTLQANHP
ncbi:uncharacterized protein LACBIDRAFT_322550 [Laccaria bicolor S238N-H82]|uniref:Predicted protein n=1 Tax=Laccaria bicolor (strain S238N-H82 / ATCC MYA-4686) TaxID=486041 RepID=B0CWP9_LACBS|nr:uncharacterized protein LACBIDRAFT_322550 [Laccaria bicolor S238N-H82]EDR13104.1 predicted protein [Laccaria bicolor S238N-H82]|eukprot:XP_001875602.1 predicted protein [Laccaria bicolor S238N-H82]